MLAIKHPMLQNKGIKLLIRREDLVHPQISGNKWYKLKYNMQQAITQGYKTVLSFGGAYSNHLHALAFAGKQYNLKTVGIVRGELMRPLNPTLQDAVEWGMQLVAISRSEYRLRHQPDFVKSLMQPYESCYLVPEGGANLLALQGCAEITHAIEQQLPEFDYLCVPCGTGATLAGLVLGLSEGMREYGARILGFCALKGLRDIEENVELLLAEAGVTDNRVWQINHDYHCGGFARLSPELVQFMQQWKAFSTIPLEPIYTGKMLLGLFKLIADDKFSPGTCIVAVHTGGLQGLRGMQAKIDRLLLAADK